MDSQAVELSKLLDLARVQRLCEGLSAAFDLTLAVLDPQGNILIASGWQDVCTRFHREHPETLRGCHESDLRINQRLVEGLGEDDHYAYRCANGLWDVAFPLCIAGEHVANIFTGQFLFDDDAVDRGAFAARARRLGWDVEAYLAALDRVPVISHDRLQQSLRFLADFVSMLGEMGLAALERERKHAELEESESRYRQLFDNATEGLVIFSVERGSGGEVVDLVVAGLNPAEMVRTGATNGQMVGRRMSTYDGDDERLRAYFSVVAGAIASTRTARCEVCLRTQGVYELLSVYPAGNDLWALSATDVTDLRVAEEALRRQEEDIRHAYVDVLDAVTGGKLILLTEDQLADQLGAPLSEAIAVVSPAQVAAARRVVAGIAEQRFPGSFGDSDLPSAVCEALDNALKHAGAGTYRVLAAGDRLQVEVRDSGPGIDFHTLPRATLVTGFSTAASLGMGFTIMLQLSRRLLLSTQPGSTIVVLEFEAKSAGARRDPAAGVTQGAIA